MAWHGTDAFVGNAIQDVRAFGYIYPNICFFVVRADSGINQLQDLKGKTLAPGPVGSGTETNAREILSYAGIDYTDNKDAKVQYLSNAESATMFVDRQVDMTYIAGGIPHASVVEMSTSTDIKILPVDGEVRENLIKDLPWYFPVRVPANTYSGQTEDVETVATGNLIIGRGDLPDEMVYEMLDQLYSNLDRLSNNYSGAKNFNMEEAFNGVTIPLHPGAIKFFEDKGLTVPDHLKP